MKLTILKHISFEEPGFFIDIFTKLGFNIHICELYSGDNPFETDFDAVLIMGGPMNIYEEAKFPWLKIEKEFIAQAIAGNIPVIGVCLGAQLIADCLGQKTYKNANQEIGWYPIKKESDNFMDFLPDFATVFHWHGETFNLPEGAKLFYSSEATKNQAFLYKNHVLALQFHLEMNLEIIKSLAEEDDYFDGTTFVMKTDEMISMFPKYQYSNQRILSNIISYFLSLNGLLKN